MLSLGVKSFKIRLFSVALGNQSGVLGLRLVEFSLSINLHQDCVLFSTNQKLLRIYGSLIDISDCVCSHFVDLSFLIALRRSDQDGCFFLGTFLADLLLGVGCNFLLFFVDLGPGD